jgi:O-antigen/teichoic acid export membrane protein
LRPEVNSTWGRRAAIEESVLRKLLGYAAYMFGANSFTALLNFGVTALGMATRPKEAVGDYALYMLIYSSANAVFILGANAAIQRFSADDAENRKRFVKLVYLVFLGLFGLSVVVGLGLWPFGLKYVLAVLGVPWIVTYWYGRYLMRSRLDARREARLMMVSSLSNTFFQFAILTFTAEQDALIYGDFLALLASGGLAMISLPRGIQVPLKEIWATPIPRKFIGEILRFAAPLWLSGQVATIRGQLQGGWTSARIGAAAMGALQATQTMWQFAGKPIEFLGQAALPGFVSAKGDRDALYRELLRFCMIALPTIGLCVGGGIPVVFAIIDFGYSLFGGGGQPIAEKYAEVPILMLLLPMTLPMTAMEMVTNQYSVAVGKPRSVFYAQLATLIAMALSLIPLAEAYGLYGVIATGLIGEVANALTYAVVLYKDHRESMRTGIKWGFYTTFATFVGMAILYWFHEHPLGFLAIAPAVGAYFLLMWIGGLVVKSDFERLVAVIRRRRGG